MQSSLIVPPDWIKSESALDQQSGPGDCAQHSTNASRIFTLDDYVKLSIFNHENGAIVSALPSLEFMATRAKVWMPKLLEILGRCDIDPALYPTMLHINADDWRGWQQGTLETVSIDTVACSRLLWEILSFIYCFVGSWDHVSWWLNQVKCWRIFNNRCPLLIIKSGDIRSLASLQHFLAGQVLGSPFS